ncbi:MAG: RluA family pseudouridine synthase [Planctomycetes bacterium]|nr:RluA family pseudouridine synthase [Planctomycetota bacterium]
MAADALYRLHRLTLEAPGQPLFAVLAERLPGLSRHQARRAIMGGLVSLAGVPTHEPKHALPDRIEVEVDLRHGIERSFHAVKHSEPVLTAKPFTFVCEDERFVVVDKAAGVMSIAPPREVGDPPPRGHLPELVRRALRKRGHECRFLGQVHRLDRETSGCLVMALDREAQRLLSEQFASHAASRVYRALVVGSPRNDAERLVERIGRGEDGRRAMVDEDDAGKEAVTSFKVLRRMRMGAELEVSLETGRTHQIRVALAGIGCPVFGDKVYAERRKRDDLHLARPKAPRLMLHAERLAFDHPSDGRRIEVVAPVPAEFDAFARLLA